MGLHEDNLLLYDKETGSLWSQIAGKAISGPLEGSPLTAIPVVQTSWTHWRSLHPGTDVMWIPDDEGRPYLYRNLAPGNRPQTKPTEHDISALGLGVSWEGSSRFYSFKEIQKVGSPFEDTLAGRTFTVRFDESVPTVWITDGEGQVLPAMFSYRFAWFSFHPDSETFSAPE